MRKKYLANKSEDFWDRVWATVDVERFQENCNPALCEILRPFLPRNEPILEGGCGPCNFVLLWTREGYDVWGIDNAANTISRVLKAFPNLPVSVGNVLEIPFPDSCFGAYYSGGVVEHFEEGPQAALAEAHRVLRPGGYLMVAVPTVNMYRSVTDFFHFVLLGKRLRGPERDADGRLALYRLARVCRPEPSPLPGYPFHEYHFYPDEMRKFLRRANFKVVKEFDYFVSTGIREVGYLQRRLGVTKDCGGGSLAGNGGWWRKIQKKIGKRLLSDRPRCGFCDAWRSVSKALFSNLTMYVAEALK